MKSNQLHGHRLCNSKPGDIVPVLMTPRGCHNLLTYQSPGRKARREHMSTARVSTSA